jgi:hypothetical protein
MDAGIQLMLRMEREAQEPHSLSRLGKYNFEKPARSLEQANRMKRIFNLSRREQRCECTQ